MLLDPWKPWCCDWLTPMKKWIEEYGGLTKKQRGFEAMKNGYLSENADLSINEWGKNGMRMGIQWDV